MNGILTKIIAFFGITALFFACSKDTTNTNDLKINSIIKIDNINYASVEFPTAKEFGVYVANSTNTVFEYSNVRYFHNGTNWKSESGMKNYSGLSPLVSAYAPYNSETQIVDNDYILFEIENGQYLNGTESSDLLFAKQTTATNSAVDLEFRHKMTKLRFELTAGKGFEQGSTIANDNSRLFYIEGVKTSVKMNTKTGEMKVLDKTNTVAPKLSQDGDGVRKPAIYEVIIPPKKAGDEYTLNLTVLNKSFKATSLKEFKEGYEYTIKMEVNDDAIYFYWFSIAPMNENPEIIESSGFVANKVDLTKHKQDFNSAIIDFEGFNKKNEGYITYLCGTQSNGIIKIEKLYDETKTIQKALAAVAYPTISLSKPDEIDYSKGIAIRVLKTYANNEDNIGTTVSQTSQIHGGRITNGVYAEGDKLAFDYKPTDNPNSGGFLMLYNDYIFSPDDYQTLLNEAIYVTENYIIMTENLNKNEN